jgi:hypothetical protein
MARDVAMEALMYGEQSEEARGHFVGCGAALALPEECGQVVGFTQEGPLSGIVVLTQDIQVQQSTCEFEV